MEKSKVDKAVYNLKEIHRKEMKSGADVIRQVNKKLSNGTAKLILQTLTDRRRDGQHV